MKRILITKQSIIGLGYISFISVFILLSCKSKDLNYITYYNKVNEIDSIYRFQKDTLTVIKQYKKLFKKYPAKNQERIQEFYTYIKLSDKYRKNFGGKKSLYRLISLVAPYDNEYNELLWLYKKHGIDSLEVKNEIAKWKRSLNKRLVDSFTVAFIRDQEEGRSNITLTQKNDQKNAELMKWTFENYGYPSLQKIGIIGNNGVFMPMLPLFTHLIDSDYYPYFKTKLLEYVKSGDCLPRDYATVVDRYNLQVSKEDILYGYYGGNKTISDTVKINYNRKRIGLPSMKHSAKIAKDFFEKK